MRTLIYCLTLFGLCTSVHAQDGRRLSNLHENSPYYPGLKYPKFITPQWIGEDGVEAVVILAIDDMRDTARYEQYLRPILTRLKKIEGRAPVSIMTNKVKPDDPQLQSWIDEGLSIECHTIDHPCPLLKDGDFAKSKSTYERCVDLMGAIPRNTPVAFRMPCCDSLNTVSPRFFTEIFNKATAKENYLQIDSSVFNFFTSDDPDIPRDLVIDADGQDKFLKYMPAGRGFVNYIENYPYPYLIDDLCWEFPCLAPSDWSAQHKHGVNNPVTLADWKAALDITVVKQGVFCLVFHPHGWIRNDQVVELIDHAVAKHGKKVKFITFRDAAERLNTLARVRSGPDALASLEDVAGAGEQPDGLLDLVLRKEGKPCQRVWDSRASRWTKETERPLNLQGDSEVLPGIGADNAGARLVDINADGLRDLIVSSANKSGAWLNPGDALDGWIQVFSVDSTQNPDAFRLPPIVRADGTDNGFFVHGRAMYWMNEDTATEKHLVAVRTFDEILAQRKDLPATPRSPQASMETIELREGFQIELVAAEPLVSDPIAFDWLPDGRMIVAEMGGYPNGAEEGRGTDGRIRLLTDSDNDGRYDKATTFLDRLNFPTGVMPWREGVLISAAPDIIYAVDTDGDGQADKREVLFTGFNEGNQQHRANGFEYGLDNWVYIANGDSGGTITSTKTGETVDIRSHDLRIKPDTGEMQRVSGRTQFGRHRDSVGNWFGNNNSNPMWHYVLEDEYLSRNSGFAPPDARHTVPEIPGNSPVYPISRTLERFNDFHTANRFTSACSTIVYDDELFGAHFRRNAFVCEPVHNLVSRMVLEPSGVTFRGARAAGEKNREFLASGDNWFRPVFIRTGPDGALWIADMYRHVIEHPEWIPDDWQKRLDLRAGHDMGRIYRVSPVGTGPLTTSVTFPVKPNPENLSHTSRWIRDTTQRLSTETRPSSVLGAMSAKSKLVRLAQSAESVAGRLHALGVLEGKGLIGEDVVLATMTDPDPAVRRYAISLAARFANSEPVVAELVKRCEAVDPAELLQLTYTLGQSKRPEAAAALATILQKHATDRYVVAAALSGVNSSNLGTMLTTVLDSEDAPRELVQSLFAMASAGGEPETLTVAATAVGSAVQTKGKAAHHRALWALTGLYRNITRATTRPTDVPDQTKTDLGMVFVAALLSVDDVRAEEHSAEFIIDAIRFFGAFARGEGYDFEDATELGDKLLHPQAAPLIQEAAVAEAARFSGDAPAEYLMSQWPHSTPRLRSQILAALLSRQSWTRRLLGAVKAGEISAVAIDAARRQQLLEHRDPAIRRQAAELFQNLAVNSDRTAVIKQHRGVLTASGDAGAGRIVFEKRCSNCHQLDGLGKQIGADLASLRDKSRESLLTAILDPNRAAEAKFLTYTIVTDEGRNISGMIRSESGNAVTLIDSEGKEHTLLRNEIDEFRSSGKSLMPEGLEQDLSETDLANVIAFVQAGATGMQPRSFDGNKPATVRPDAGGSVRLTARQCRIYGPSLVFESHYGNLGFWGSADDHGVWSVEGLAPGTYKVLATVAAPDDIAGQKFQVSAGVNRVVVAVPATGSWNRYRQFEAGRLKIDGNTTTIRVQSAGPVSGFLMDLRELMLVPAK